MYNDMAETKCHVKEYIVVLKAAQLVITCIWALYNNCNKVLSFQFDYVIWYN